MDREERVGQRTVENGTNEESDEIGLLGKVKPVWDLGGVRVAGPRRSPITSHGLDACAIDGTDSTTEGRSGVREQTSERDWEK